MPITIYLVPQGTHAPAMTPGEARPWVLAIYDILTDNRRLHDPTCECELCRARVAIDKVLGPRTQEDHEIRRGAGVEGGDA